jgi:hypothetical protein
MEEAYISLVRRYAASVARIGDPGPVDPGIVDPRSTAERQG